MTIPLVTTSNQTVAASAISIHQLALQDFLDGSGAVCTKYICSLEGALEGQSKNVKITLMSLQELQIALLLTYALWRETEVEDYGKLFVQILPHYLLSIEEAQNKFPPLLSCGATGDLLEELRDVTNLKVKAPVDKEFEWETLGHLVEEFVARNCFDKLSETLAEAFADWTILYPSDRRFNGLLTQACKICCLGGDSSKFYPFYQATSYHFLKVTKRPDILYNNCWVGVNTKMMESHILQIKPLRELHARIVSDPFFPEKTRNSIVNWSIKHGWFSHAIAQSRRLTYTQVINLQAIIADIYKESSELLQAPWKAMEDSAMYEDVFSRFTLLAEKDSCAPYKYLLLQKIAAKREEVRADSRIRYIKEEASQYSRK